MLSKSIHLHSVDVNLGNVAHIVKIPNPTPNPSSPLSKRALTIRREKRIFVNSVNSHNQDLRTEVYYIVFGIVSILFQMSKHLTFYVVPKFH